MINIDSTGLKKKSRLIISPPPVFRSSKTPPLLGLNLIQFMEKSTKAMPRLIKLKCIVCINALFNFWYEFGKLCILFLGTLLHFIKLAFNKGWKMHACWKMQTFELTLCLSIKFSKINIYTFIFVQRFLEYYKFWGKQNSHYSRNHTIWKLMNVPLS